MIHHFPLFTAAHTLARQDFRNFLDPFSQVVKEKILTAAEVYFLEHVEQIEDLPDTIPKHAALREAFVASASTGEPTGQDHCLLFAFVTHDQQAVIALVAGLNPLFVRKAGRDWLQETGHALQREFLVVKQAGVDLQTGLLNGAHLNTLFDTWPEGEHVGLLLVEIYPRVRTAMEDMQHVRRSAATLKSFLGEHTPLYHIGQSVFAYPCRNCDEDSAARFGPLLVSFLKQEHFKRVHVGYSQGKINTCQPDQDEESPTTNGRQILDQAWLALQTACKRGPFSFCTYHSLQSSQRHPLYASDRDIQGRIRPHWQRMERFALVQLHPEKPITDLYQRISLNIAGGSKIRGRDNDVFLLLPFSHPQQILTQTRDIIESITRQEKDEGGIAAGIALFPFHDFKKSETLQNCRKALLHGELEGQSAITLFDALSLNVSGDIFYGEGDIPRAIREYRRGLRINPHDVNLLNSLGVGYAMMNRHREAVDCFQKALAIEKDHFISWYNLGLERKQQGDHAGAVDAFEHALGCATDDEQDTGSARRELPLQLGKLYSQTGRYQDAIAVLIPWYQAESGNPGSGRALRHLGESFHGIGRDREAMSWLQRAIRFDEFDAEALSLLGEIYLDNHEGDQIALKLCEKSIELNQTQPLFYLRLACAQIQCGHPAAAKESLRLCLNDKKTKGAAAFQMGLLYRKQGQKARAGHWFARALKDEPATTRWHALAREHLSAISLQPR